MVQIIVLPAGDGERVELTFPFDPAILATVKRLPGSRWDRERRRWSIPRRTMPRLNAGLNGRDVKIVERKPGIPLPSLPSSRMAPKEPVRRSPALPSALGPEELERLLASVHNLKHRAIALILYEAGLRPSQVVRLRVEDVEHDRGLVRVRSRSGRTVRRALLPPRVAGELLRYRALYRPATWLFTGSVANRPLSTHSVRKLIVAALHRAGMEESSAEG